MKEKIKIILISFLLFLICAPIAVNAFVANYEFSYYDPPGFFSGVYYGLLSPYSLVARWFLDDIEMYAVPNK